MWRMERFHPRACRASPLAHRNLFWAMGRDLSWSKGWETQNRFIDWCYSDWGYCSCFGFFELFSWMILYDAMIWRANYLGIFFWSGLGIIFGFLLLCFSCFSCFSRFSCFSAFLLFLLFLLLCFSAFLLFCFSCFSGFLLFCVSCFFASLLFLLSCFSAFLLFLLLCLSAVLLLCVSCFFASLLFCFSAFFFCFACFKYLIFM